MKEANETFIFIGSGTQILPFDKLFTEAWYGESRKRLFDLIIENQKSGIVLLSGDIHCAEILKTFCKLPELGYDLIEITSSGLSHFCGFKLIQEHIFPNNYNTGEFINDYNFAFLEFDWGKSKEEAKFIIRIKNIQNEEKIKRLIKYRDLRFSSLLLNSRNNSECYQKINSRFKSLGEYISYYIDNPLRLVQYIVVYFLVILIFSGFYLLAKNFILIFLNIFKQIYKRLFKKSKLN